MVHRVKGLRWARQAVAPPFKVARRGSSAAAQKGIAFERALANAVDGARPHLWWEFEDSTGVHWCQTDLVVPGAKRALVMEAKYTWCLRGHLQLERLYRPVLEEALGKEILTVQVCKRLVKGMPSGLVVCATLEEAIRAAKGGDRPVWHWIGVGGRETRPTGGPPLGGGQPSDAVIA